MNNAILILIGCLVATQVVLFLAIRRIVRLLNRAQQEVGPVAWCEHCDQAFDEEPYTPCPECKGALEPFWGEGLT